jgi:hemerythrin-like domain-containing protein
VGVPGAGREDVGAADGSPPPEHAVSAAIRAAATAALMRTTRPPCHARTANPGAAHNGRVSGQMAPDHATHPTQKGPAVMSTDAIVLLKDDHKEIRRLFREFESAGEAATATRSRIAKKILEELTVHTYIENEVMYPEVRKLLPDVEDDVLESYEEHHVADVLCMELAAMSPDNERFDAKMTVLMENVKHHMEEEEEEWFPKVREGLGRNQLQEIGAKMAEMKKTAPRSPAQPSAVKKAVDAVIA